jgi:hypothetical protein
MADEPNKEGSEEFFVIVHDDKSRPSSRVLLKPPSKEERKLIERKPSNTILNVRMTPDFYAHINKLLEHEERNRERALQRAREQKEKDNKSPPSVRQRKEIHYNYEILN